MKNEEIKQTGLLEKVYDMSELSNFKTPILTSTFIIR